MKLTKRINQLLQIIFLLLIVLQPYACSTDTGIDEEPDGEETIDGLRIQVGTRTVITDKYTADGTPVVPMWKAPLFNPLGGSTGGFEGLKDAEHAIVWQPKNLEDGAYNHYACLTYYKGRFYAMWGNHRYGEDGPGQRVMYASSDKWGKWTDAEELFPAPGPVLPRDKSGIHLKPDRWAIVDDNLYAITYATGAGTGYAFARQVSENGEFGAPFLLRGLPSNNSQLPVYMDEEEHSGPPPPIGIRLAKWYDETDQISWWAGGTWGIRRTAVDGQTLIESFMYRAKDGGLVLMMRDWGHNNNPVHNNRIYVSFNNSGSGVWSAPYPSDIPDSPGRTEAVTLDDGTILLIGNQIISVFDQARYIDRTPITVAVSSDGYVFDRVYSLRANAPRGFRLAGDIGPIGGRQRGFQYSSSIVVDGWLYTLYSVGKEDMGITRVPLSNLEL